MIDRKKMRLGYRYNSLEIEYCRIRKKSRQIKLMSKCAVCIKHSGDLVQSAMKKRATEADNHHSAFITRLEGQATRDVRRERRTTLRHKVTSCLFFTRQSQLKNVTSFNRQ